MKKILLFILASAFSLISFGQTLQKINTFKTDSVTGLPLQEVVTNFYIDWGVNQSAGIDSIGQVIIVNVKQYVMTSDTSKVLIEMSRSRRINQGTDDFNRWFNHFADFGNLIYEELVNDSIQ